MEEVEFQYESGIRMMCFPRAWNVTGGVKAVCCLKSVQVRLCSPSIYMYLYYLEVLAKFGVLFHDLFSLEFHHCLPLGQVW